MVSTLAPSSCSASTVQDFIALPLTWTTQAPHCEVSQPTWVPVSRRFSRSNCTSSVRGSTSPETGLPFTVRETAAMGSSSSKIIAVKRFDLRAGLIAGCIRGRNRGDFAGFVPWNENYSEPRPRRRSREFRGRIAAVRILDARTRGPAAHQAAFGFTACDKIAEKIVGDFLGGAVDQALAELRELAADLRLDRRRSTACRRPSARA